MKKRTERTPISMRMIEKDLEALFQVEDLSSPDVTHEESGPSLTLQQATQLFDELMAVRNKPERLSRESQWTNKSVLTLGDRDPISEIVSRARHYVLDAIEEGWSGPPYNPFSLAEMRGMRLLPTEEILDARTRSDREGNFTIEFNPQRPAARMRYSIAHEIGHTLFKDCAEAIRNRATHQDMKKDDWQLESLCNMAAAEILMPFGTFQEEVSVRPSAGLVLDLRHKYLVSCEAIVNRLIRLSTYPCFAFFARVDNSASRYFVEYYIPSPALREDFAIRRGYVLPLSSRASACTAIGARDQEDARWVSNKESWFIEYLGISPNPGEVYPRVLALAFPPLSDDFSASEPIRFMVGDASEPFGADAKVLLQVVNDRASLWGGGFAKHCGKKWRSAQTKFREWAMGRGNLKLGNIHYAPVRPDLTLVSLVSQHGFAKASSGPRLRYGALFSALEKVAELATAKCATVHMPRIGTGEAGGSWNVIEGIIRETLVSKGIRVTIYDLRRRNDDIARQPSFEFPQEMADEVI
jgi:Zn-dependent peptidase ImmA (M78 family)/O-acetyl-ADP-ribose deacetylase (regulator of RNase III)